MPKIALTCGDPAGVGPEIIERWLAENPQEASEVVAIGPQSWLEKLPCEGIAVGEKDFEITPGAPTEAGQRLALAAMERAAAGTKNGEFSAVVTSPVNKAGLQSVGYTFPGQTEFFADRWGGVPVMAFAGGKLSVVLTTWHIPLKDVPAALTVETLTRAVEQADVLARALGKAASCRFGRSGILPLQCADNPSAKRRDAASPSAPSSYYNPMADVHRHAANLPHWEQNEKLYFVTFRLADSIPAEKLNAWVQMRDAWLEHHPQPHDEKTEQEYSEKFGEAFESLLEEGHGSCCLRKENIRKIVENALLHFDGVRYELYSFVVMPNHVHVLFKTLGTSTPEEILHSWKSFSSKKINAELNQVGVLWKKEYWDRLIRNPRHFESCLRYIKNNPGNMAIPVYSSLEKKVQNKDSGSGETPLLPRIGVCGLNPHAGEKGILGREEIEIIEPILENLRSRFPGLSRCVPADTIFARQLRGEFDVVVALYHDQALAPLKTLEFDEAVNISMGLPHVRTSPDHGTAYDIAGKGTAQTKSFANAVRLARLLANR